MAYIAKTTKKDVFFLFLGYQHPLMFSQVKMQLGPNFAPFWEGFGGQVEAKIIKKSILTCIIYMMIF